MRKNFTLLLCALLFTVAGHAQIQDAPLFKIKKFGIHLGEDQDRLIGMDHTTLIRAVDKPLAMELEDIDFTKQDVTSMICENPHLRMDLTVVPRFAPRSEIRFSAIGMFNRIDAVYFSKYDPDIGFSTLDYESRGHEVALEAAISRKLPIGRSVNFYLGGGTNAGYSFNNTVQVSGYNVRLAEAGAADEPVYHDYDYFSDTYTAHNSVHQRVFAEVGFGVTIAQRVELAAHYRFGYGYKWTTGANQFTGTNYRSGGLSIRYQLK